MTISYFSFFHTNSIHPVSKAFVMENKIQSFGEANLNCDFYY